MGKTVKITIKIIAGIIGIVLALLVLSGVWFIIANAINKSDVTEYAARTGADYNTGIHGAIYVPANAYNAWQMYRDYDESEIDRDFSYAESTGLNAIRVFTSYEYWLDDPDSFFDKFEHLVICGESHGIRLLPILFEDCGVDNTPENREADTDETGFCVCSPERSVQKNKNRFSEVDGFIDAFMLRYGNDERLLAIEVMNEPHILSGNLGFANYALKKVRSYEGTVPITMGQLTIFHNILFAGKLDIYQYHDNYPSSQGRLVFEMKLANFFQKITGRPHWLTEWQRVRLSGGGWGSADIPEEDKTPDLASLAGVVKENNVSNFFWSLMVKKAYLPTQRLNGTFNGLFYEDGSVYSETDLEAIKSLVK